MYSISQRAGIEGDVEVSKNIDSSRRGDNSTDEEDKVGEINCINNVGV